jgi:hypothetical protein
VTNNIVSEEINTNAKYKRIKIDLINGEKGYWLEKFFIIFI